MKSKLLLLASAIVLMSFALVEQKKITIWMIGDSTMSIKSPGAYPETGWGMPFSTFFNKKVVVENKAMNGRSTLSFINEKRWEYVINNIKPDDYLIIEFGHNDEKINKPGTGTLIPQYKANLARFVTEARAKRANPILLTPIARRNFVNGQLVDTHMDYPAAVKQVADSLHVPLIDMLGKTSSLLSALGEEKSITLFNHVPPGTPNYPKGKKDDTHLSVEGARRIASLAVDGIKELNLDISKYLRK